MPFIFRLQETPVGRAVFVETVFPSSLRMMALWGTLSGVFVCVSLFLLTEARIFLGVATLAASPALALFLFELFVENGLKRSELAPTLQELMVQSRKGAVVNAARYCAYPVAWAIAKSVSPLSARKTLRNLIGLKRMDFVFFRLGLKKNDLEQYLQEAQGPQNEDELFATVLEEALRHAVRFQHRRIEIGDMMRALAEHEFAFRRFLFDRGYAEEDLDRVLHWEARLFLELRHRKQFWHRDILLRIPGLGIHWAAGYTVALDRYSRDITGVIAEQGWELRVIGRKNEILAMERALAKTGENNVLLVGEPGVGKETIVYGFAKRVLEGKSLSQLNRRRVVEVDMQAVISGLKTTGEIEERLRKIFGEAVRARNIILIIKDLHNFVAAETAVGTIDIAAAIIPFIRTNAMQLIATTTYEGLHEHVEKNQDVLRYFEKVEVQPPAPPAVFAILTEMLPIFEKRHRVFFTYRSMSRAIEFADRYIQDIPFPEKAIDIVGDVAVFVSNAGREIVTDQDVATVVAQRIQIPVGEVTKEEREKLLNLEQFIHERVVDQEEAVKVISEAMRRERAGVRVQTKKPIGTFLFLGPTGVGKTETAKALAEAYFGSEERMIRFDMSEYQKQDAFDRLIGSPAMREEGRLSVTVREDPFSLLLLDELDKTHPKILDLFLQIFDEGKATDGWGKQIIFANTIIIATSNAGAEFIREKVQENMPFATLKQQLIEYILSQGIFRPEFVNRFDAVVVFKPLAMADVMEIARLKIKKLAGQLYEVKGISLEVPDAALSQLVSLGFSKEFGARELNRVLQERIEGVLARELLSGNLKRGDTFVVPSEVVGEK